VATARRARARTGRRLLLEGWEPGGNWRVIVTFETVAFERLAIAQDVSLSVVDADERR